MRGKPVTSGERAIIFNVFKHLKGNFPIESQRSIIERTSKATGSSYFEVLSSNINSDLLLKTFKISS